MTVNSNPAGGAPGDGSGAPSGDDSLQSGEQTPTSTAKVVPWENHQRALNDMHTFKKKVSELEAKLGEVESEKLKATNNYQELYNQEKARREKAEADASKTLSWAANTQRHATVKAIAEKKGIRKEALGDLELLDMSEVEVEATDRGRFVVSGAEEWVDKIKTERGHWFTQPTPPTINTGGGGVPPHNGTGKLTPDDVHQAERKWKRKEITEAEYIATYQKYAAQSKPTVVLPGTNPAPNRS